MKISADFFDGNTAARKADELPDGSYYISVINEKTCSNGALMVSMEVADGDYKGYRFNVFYNLDNDTGKMFLRLLISSTALEQIEDTAELVGAEFRADVVTRTYMTRDGEEKKRTEIKRYLMPDLMNKKATKTAAENLGGFNGLPF